MASTSGRDLSKFRPIESSTEKSLRDTLRLLKPGDEVAYTDWRGDKGEGTVLAFMSRRNKEVDPKAWGFDKLDAIIIKRNFSSDEGRYFRPLLGDGDTVMVLHRPTRIPAVTE